MGASEAIPGASAPVQRCSLVTTPPVPFYTRAHMGRHLESGASTYIPTPGLLKRGIEPSPSWRFRTLHARATADFT